MKLQSKQIAGEVGHEELFSPMLSESQGENLGCVAT